MSLSYQKSKVRVLVVDDEDSIRNMLTETLKDDGWDVQSAVNGKLAVEKFKEWPAHIIISDINMPEMTGTELLEHIKKTAPQVEFLIMTSHATLETAVKAVQLGAYDYLNKPFEDIEVVPKKLEQVAEKILLRQQNIELLKRLKAAGKDLKNLLASISPLNGILEISELAKSVIDSFPVLFDDEAFKAAWWTHKDGQWACVHACGIEVPSEPLDDVERAPELMGEMRNPELHFFKYQSKTDDVLVYEATRASLANVFVHQIDTSYQKAQFHFEIASMANKDGLTKLYNHRYFQERLQQEISQAKRQKSFVSLLLMDVDNFKHYNDTNGHPAGDKLLKELAELLNTQGKSIEGSRREADIVARYGGEEFVMILPFTPLEGAKVKAERVRQAIADFEFDHREKQPLGIVSASIGVATFPDHGSNKQDLINAADKALYEAKHNGRNQAVGYDVLIEAAKKAAESSTAESSKVEESAEDLDEIPQPESEPKAEEEAIEEVQEESASEALPEPPAITDEDIVEEDIFDGAGSDSSATPPPPPPPPPPPEAKGDAIGLDQADDVKLVRAYKPERAEPEEEALPPPPTQVESEPEVNESEVDLSPPPPPPPPVAEEESAEEVVVEDEEPHQEEDLPPPPPPPMDEQSDPNDEPKADLIAKALEDAQKEEESRKTLGTILEPDSDEEESSLEVAEESSEFDIGGLVDAIGEAVERQGNPVAQPKEEFDLKVFGEEADSSDDTERLKTGKE